MIRTLGYTIALAVAAVMAWVIWTGNRVPEAADIVAQIRAEDPSVRGGTLTMDGCVLIADATRVAADDSRTLRRALRADLAHFRLDTVEVAPRPDGRWTLSIGRVAGAEALAAEGRSLLARAPGGSERPQTPQPPVRIGMGTDAPAFQAFATAALSRAEPGVLSVALDYEGTTVRADRLVAGVVAIPEALRFNLTSEESAGDLAVRLHRYREAHCAASDGD